MNRPLFGLILGTLIGVLDGSTAYVTAPELRTEIMGILLGSAFKGLVGGLITGIIARRTGSLLRGAVVGLLVGVALAVPVAWQNANHYEDNSIYWKIIAPGALTGALVGYGLVRFGRRSGQPA